MADATPVSDMQIVNDVQLAAYRFGHGQITHEQFADALELAISQVRRLIPTK